MEIKTSYQISKQLKQNKSYRGLSLSRYANTEWVNLRDMVKEMNQYDTSEFPLREILKKHPELSIIILHHVNKSNNGGITKSHALKCGAFSRKLRLDCTLRSAFGFITSAVWLCYKSLSLNQHGMSEISTCV